MNERSTRSTRSTQSTQNTQSTMYGVTRTLEQMKSNLVSQLETLKIQISGGGNISDEIPVGSRVRRRRKINVPTD